MATLWNRFTKKPLETANSSSTAKLVESGNSSTDNLSEGMESLSVSQKEVTLISSDNKSFEVTLNVACKSLTIKALIEDGWDENAIPLPNVTGNTLGKIVEFVQQHVAYESSNKKKEDLSKWDARFVYQFTESELFDLVLAAHYLDIADLYDLMCQAIADVAKTKTPDGILKMFNITKDTNFET